MATLLDELPPGARVLLIRLRSLGDCVLTTPAIALLHAHRPDLRIAVMVEDRFAAIFDNNPAVSEILPPSASLAFRFRPALSINLHGGPQSARLTLASLARRRAAYSHFRTRIAYNITIPRAQDILGQERTVHTAEHVASAMFFLGVPQSEIPRASLFLSGRTPLKSKLAIVHPFASAPSKAWPAEKFAALCRWLRSERGYEVAVVGASTDDFKPFTEFLTLKGANLETIKRSLASAALFAGNDSGPAHMAAAFGLPVTVLYGTSDPVIWAPWRTRSEIVTAPESLAAVPFETVRDAVARLERSQ